MNDKDDEKADDGDDDYDNDNNDDEGIEKVCVLPIGVISHVECKE